MPCPFFYPVSALSDSDPRSAMLPLGDFWEGTCHAASPPIQPDPVCQRRFCNLGYARGACGRFAESAGPDAARFTVKRDTGASVELYFVLERDHLPFAHGPLEFSRAGQAFLAAPADGILHRQALAYVECYLRRSADAPARLMREEIHA